MKNFYHIFLLLFLFTRSISYSQTSSEKLIAYYPFNGNANDVSGHSYHALVNGATLATDRFNNPNSAYYFDGIDDNIILPSSFDLLPKTISFWFYPQTVDAFSRVMYVSDNPNLNYGITAIEIKTINGVPKVATHITSSRDTATITANTWHNFVITINADSTHFYLNGVLLKSRKVTGFPKSNTGENRTFVGSHRQVNTSSIYFHGKIDDVKIYNRELTEEEVSDSFDMQVSLELGANFCVRSGESVQLQVPGFRKYLWSTGETGSKIQITSPGVYNVTVTDYLGNTHTDEIMVETCSEVQIPNIFTPNGDGQNDTFIIKGLMWWGSIKNSIWELVVTNRWGAQVFYSSDYKNDWDGANQSEGVYYYQFSNKSLNQSYKGWVEIVR